MLHKLACPISSPAIVSLVACAFIGCVASEQITVRPGTVEFEQLAINGATRPADLYLASGDRIGGYLLMTADSLTVFSASASTPQRWYALSEVNEISFTGRNHRRGFALGAAVGLGVGLVASIAGMPSCSDGSSECTAWQSAGFVVGSALLSGALGWSLGARETAVYRIEPGRK
jgi:hypothetical protein